MPKHEKTIEALRKWSDERADNRVYASHVFLEDDEDHLKVRRVDLTRNPTDFSVLGSTAKPPKALQDPEAKPRVVGPGITRVRASSTSRRDNLMDQVRNEAVAHHIYCYGANSESDNQNNANPFEILISDRILLSLREPDAELLEGITGSLRLVHERDIGETHVLRVQAATGHNPVKTANRLAELEEVRTCSPEILLPLEIDPLDIEPLPQGSSSGGLPPSWHLDTRGVDDRDVLSYADINVAQAWKITEGKPEIKIAVMDDGFDLKHPALRGVRIDTKNARDFLSDDPDPSPELPDRHGTPVATLAMGAVGVARNCTFLPIRVVFGGGRETARPVRILEAFEHASKFADVLICSFGVVPSPVPLFLSLRGPIAKLTGEGYGRLGKGLVIVFAAGNSDAPTHLAGPDNEHGITFLNASKEVVEIPHQTLVFSVFPTIEGVTVVSAMSSRLRKAGYSNWGQEITLAAPSNNTHQMLGLPEGYERRKPFEADYRGKGLVAAVNRPGIGSASQPLRDVRSTKSIQENHFTDRFGGTSGAAPLVGGVVGLMLSVNEKLTPKDVNKILIETADKNVDHRLDNLTDPNLKGRTGEFVNGKSLFFGAGKVNAFEAVRRAQDLGSGSV